MYLVQDAVGRELPLSYALSLLILYVCLLMALSAWLESAGRRNRAEPAARSPMAPCIPARAGSGLR